MRRVDVRELGSVTSIAVNTGDYVELMESKAFRRMAQLLYGTVDSLYGDMLRPGLTNEQIHFVRGRISAFEEILGIKDMVASEAACGSLMDNSEDGHMPDGDEAFRTVMDNLTRGTQDV